MVEMQLYMNTMLNEMIDDYNLYAEGWRSSIPKIDSGGRVSMPCLIVGILKESYGKYPEDSSQFIMEYSHFTYQLVNYLPSTL
jgi:hypothetical protein